MTVFWILTSTSFGSKKNLAEFILKCNIYLFISLSFSITQMRNSVHFLLVLSFLESKKRVKFRFSWLVHVLMCTIVYQEIFFFLILPPSKSGACAKVVPFFWNNTKIIDTRFTFNKIVELNRLKAELNLQWEKLQSSKNLFYEDELFFYPSILSGDDKIMIVSNIIIGNETTIKSSCQNYNVQIELMRKYVRLEKDWNQVLGDQNFSSIEYIYWLFQKKIIVLLMKLTWI